VDDFYLSPETYAGLLVLAFDREESLVSRWPGFTSRPFREHPFAELRIPT
jgi:hypothetical protein